MDGLLLINKPVGITSFDVIRKLKKVFKNIKLGHTGTLDPIAEGVLVVMLGNTNKLRFFFENDYKTYFATMKLGYISDTYDSEGVIEKITDNIPTQFDVIRALKALSGNYNQTPPEYSAVKVNGKPAYYWKREKNMELKLNSKMVGIQTRFICKDNDIVTFVAKVTKGTYIRTLINDIGEYLKCGAYMISLKRVKNGEFKLNQTVEVSADKSTLSSKVISNSDFFKKYEHYRLSKEFKTSVANGVLLNPSLFHYFYGKKIKGNYLPVYCDDKLICFVKRLSGENNIEYKRVLIANN